MKKYKTTIILVIILIITAAIFAFINSSYSPLEISNICQDNEYARTVYETEKNPKKLLSFALKRANNCKTLLYMHKKDTDIYKKMDNCDLLETAGIASGFVINYSVQHLREFDTAKQEYTDIKKAIQPYDYCPQYTEVNKALDSFAKSNLLKTEKQ